VPRRFEPGKRKVRDLLRFAVLRHGEVLAAQPGDRPAAVVEHAHVDRHERDAAAEGGRLLLRRILCLRPGDQQ